MRNLQSSHFWGASHIPLLYLPGSGGVCGTGLRLWFWSTMIYSRRELGDGSAKSAGESLASETKLHLLLPGVPHLGCPKRTRRLEVQVVHLGCHLVPDRYHHVSLLPGLGKPIAQVLPLGAGNPKLKRAVWNNKDSGSATSVGLPSLG